MHRRIWFNAWVTAEEPVEGKFPLVLESGEAFIFDGIILATGHQSVTISRSENARLSAIS